MVAVRVQVRTAAHALRAFAERQADWCQQGWEIAHTEVPRDWRTSCWRWMSQPIRLSGRIDRIDVHAETGEHMILDYKSSDAGDGPEKTHRRKRSGQWIDLQLPLYRHLARAIVSTGPIRLGYILLPKDTTKTGLAIADWSDRS